jgi:hypothetical protein
MHHLKDKINENLAKENKIYEMLRGKTNYKKYGIVDKYRYIY